MILATLKSKVKMRNYTLKEFSEHMCSIFEYSHQLVQNNFNYFSDGSLTCSPTLEIRSCTKVSIKVISSKTSHNKGSKSIKYYNAVLTLNEMKGN